MPTSRSWILFCIILLSGCLFEGISIRFVSAEVIQAYRKPSEADLQWLFGNETAPDSISSGITQTGITQAGFTETEVSEKKCAPCERVGLPTPPIPPAPKIIGNHTPTGISQPFDSQGTIEQMGGKHLPPPPDVPKEPNMLPETLSDVIPERLPTPTNQDFLDSSQHFSTAPSGTDLTCQSFTRRANIVTNPDMVGNSALLSGAVVGTNLTRFSVPTMMLSQPNITEHFNADVQNRFWADYRHWNNAVSFAQDNITESRAVEQFVFGLEKKILKNTSLELRVPIFGQYESEQQDNFAETSAELGNITMFVKQVLKRNSRWTISSGVGITIPTAEDWQGLSGKIQNEMYYLSSFFGVQWHPNRDTFGHFVLQGDFSIAKNEWQLGSNRLDIDGQQILRSGIQLGRWIYRNDHGTLPCRLGSFVELNYAVAVDGISGKIQTLGNDTYYVQGIDSGRYSLTATLGLPMVFGKWGFTNSLVFPISGSGSPFDVGYNFSLVRQF